VTKELLKAPAMKTKEKPKKRLKENHMVQRR
jgi:hypothetical protein